MGTPINTVQSTGGFSMSISNVLVNAGASMIVGGIKLEGTFLTLSQDVENSKRVAFVDGTSSALTNAIRMGKITVNCAKTAGQASGNDLIWYCDQLKRQPDSNGSTITIVLPMNGKNVTYTLVASTLVTCPPLIIAGNDIPDYSVVFSFADYSVAYD